MTTSSPKSFNYLALRGGAVDDMEVVDEHGLDPKLAYTPQINDAMLEKVYQENLAAGVDEKTARKNMMSAKKNIMNLMK